MKLVRAAVNRNVDDAASGAAMFGFEATGLDLNLLNEFERKGVLRAQRSTDNIGDFDAIQEVGVFETA